MGSRRCAERLAGLTAAVAFLLGVSSDAQSATATCPAKPVAQVFLPWADPAWYESVPDGGFEADAAGWTLRGGAAVVDGNEPYSVRGRSDRRSLALGDGAWASGAPACVAVGHPTLRFFVRNTGSSLGRLQVSAEFVDALGVPRSLLIGTVAGTAAWAPSPPVPITINTISALAVNEVRFRFAPSSGDWRIDDVYVDPYGKG